MLKGGIRERALTNRYRQWLYHEEEAIVSIIDELAFGKLAELPRHEQRLRGSEPRRFGKRTAKSDRSDRSSAALK